MKKYIIELPENTYWIQWLMEGTKDHHPYMDFKQVEDLTPYTEPDLDAIREEAYDKGYNDANVKISSNEQAIAEKAYQKGLYDAWEATKTIINWDWDTKKAVFGDVHYLSKIIADNTASEAIEKIRQYEQEKEEQIQVGDEVAFHHDGRPDTVVVVTHIGQDGFIDGMDGKGIQYAHKNPKKWTKTGRFFPEVAELLRKMKGES